MNLLKRIFGSSEPEITKQKKVYSQRSFLAGLHDRLTNDWSEVRSLNISIRDGLDTLRARSRDLAINNEYARRYYKLIKANIVGPDGVQVSVQAKNADGSPDLFSDVIELAFWDWATKPEHCSVNGKLDFSKIQEILIETIARDGEALVWFRRGPQFGKYAFQLQLIDIDHLDHNYSADLNNGNRIVQGVELDGFEKPVAYWIWQKNPNENIAHMGNKRIRVSADDLKHIFDPERASQVRGFPWTCASMLSLQHITKFREATLVSARMAANKATYYTQTEQEGFDDGGDDATDDYRRDLAINGSLTFDSTPGSQEILPANWGVQTVEFTAPTEQLGEFQKNVLKGAAAGLGISYNSLACDLESVNYSSARFGALEDQALYRSMQRFFINSFIRPVYESWLEMQLLTARWSIPVSKFDKFANVQYRPRSWQSVDPVKDTNADRLKLEAGLTSWSDVIAKSGRDPDEVFSQIAKDKEKMASLGITPAFLNEQLTAQGFTEDEASGMNKKPAQD